MKKINFVLLSLFLVSCLSANEPNGKDPKNEKTPGLGFRVLEPRARIYFDSEDNPDEIDIFDDGSISVTVNVVDFYYSWNWSDYLADKNHCLHVGLALGTGFTESANNSEDGEKEASSAPVALVSAGVFLEIFSKKDEDKSFIVELGKLVGFSSDESFSDISDSAIYFGLGISF